MIEELEEGRYLTQQGLVIPKHEAESKLERAFQVAVGYIKLPEVIIPIGLSFANAASSDNFSELSLVLSAVMALGFVPQMKAISYLIDRYYHQTKHLYFDKKSDGSVTSPENRKKSIFVAGLNATIAGSMTAACLQALANDNKIDLLSVLSITTIASALILPSAFSTYRNIQVVRHKWNLIDEPPQQEKREEKITRSKLAFDS